MMCVQVRGSQHRCRVHVNKRMEKTVKSGNYSATNDRTFDGATAGVTPFATPHLSPKLIRKDEMDYHAFKDATHKMQANNKKFLAEQKFNPPKELSELIRVLNNYICWTEVMFGNHCPHLLLIVRLQDVLDKNQDILKPVLDKHLLMTILWRAHEDSRQFFYLCDKWNYGKLLPQSTLKGMVDLFEYDQHVSRSLTCIFDDFFHKQKPPGKGKPGGASGGGGNGGGRGRAANNDKDKDPKKPQPTVNPTLLPLCLTAVNKLKKAHPGLTIPKFAMESRILAHRLTGGKKGECTNYQLPGQCTTMSCTYKHIPCLLTDARQKEVAALILEGLKVIKDKAKPAPA
jgi:hypothetical protein